MVRPPGANNGGMKRDLDACDVIDVLEESAVTGRAVEVELRDGDRFVDRVTDVTTASGHDSVRFERRGEMEVQAIAACAPAPAGPPSYDAKLP